MNSNLTVTLCVSITEHAYLTSFMNDNCSL